MRPEIRLEVQLLITRGNVTEKELDELRHGTAWLNAAESEALFPVMTEEARRYFQTCGWITWERPS